MTPSAVAPQSREEWRAASHALSPSEWPSVPEHAGSAADPDWRQIVRALEARIAGLEVRVEQATAEFETGAQARLQKSFGDALTQARERMKHYANACGESRLIGLESELDHRLEPFLNRSQAAINDLERLLDTLRQEQAAWEARMVQRRQQDEARHLQDPVDLRLQRLSESLKRGGRCA